MALDDLRAFLSLVEQGSSVASRSIDAAKSKLADRVEALEQKLGTPLVSRVADAVTLTRAGERLADAGRKVVTEANGIWEAALQLKNETPPLIVEVPVGLAPSFEQALYVALRRAAPIVPIHIRYLSGPPDEQSDAWISLHSTVRPDSPGWSSRKLASLDRRLLASEAYLSNKGAPLATDELTQHVLFVASPSLESVRSLPLLAGGAVPVRPALTTPNAHFARKLAQDGAGIAFAPRLPQVFTMLSDETLLVPVLDALVGDQTELYLSIRKRDGALDAVGSALARFLATILSGVADARASEPPRGKAPGS